MRTTNKNEDWKWVAALLMNFTLEEDGQRNELDNSFSLRSISDRKVPA